MTIPSPKVQCLFDKSTGNLLTISGGVVSPSNTPLLFGLNETLASIATTYSVSFSANVILVPGMFISDNYQTL